MLKPPELFFVFVLWAIIIFSFVIALSSVTFITGIALVALLAAYCAWRTSACHIHHEDVI